jgi:hypothetical protein
MISLSKQSANNKTSGECTARQAQVEVAAMNAAGILADSLAILSATGMLGSQKWMLDDGDLRRAVQDS